MTFPDEIPQDEMSMREKEWRIAGLEVMAIPDERHIVSMKELLASYKLEGQTYRLNPELQGKTDFWLVNAAVSVYRSGQK